MDIQSLIQSGLLESYVLGHCTAEERAQVEQAAAQSPEVKAEIAAIEQALEGYATASALAPPAWMKGRIMDSIQAEQLAADQSQATQTSMDTTGKVLISKLLLGALMFFALAMTMLNWYSIYNNRLTVVAYEAAVKESQACQQREQDREKTQREIAFLRDPATKMVEVRWLDGSAPDAVAKVFTNPTKQETNLSFANLPALAADKDYQLWVIVEGNPDPLPLNVFQPGTDPLASLPVEYRDKAQAFAVSLEPKGGSPNGKPTQVVMLGKLVG